MRPSTIARNTSLPPELMADGELLYYANAYDTMWRFIIYSVRTERNSHIIHNDCYSVALYKQKHINSVGIAGRNTLFILSHSNPTKNYSELPEECPAIEECIETRKTNAPFVAIRLFSAANAVAFHIKSVESNIHPPVKSSRNMWRWRSSFIVKCLDAVEQIHVCWPICQQ